MQAIFLSDVHLKDGNSTKSQLVIRFLQEVCSRYENVYIMGDFFDVWPVTSSYLIQVYQPVLSALEILVKGGCRVVFIEGNHDFHLGDYFKDQLGIEVYANEYESLWNGKRILLSHGDLGNPKDLKYKWARSFLRSRLAKTALEILPARWIYETGLKSSALSRNYQDVRGRNLTSIRDTYRNTAKSYFHKGYDIVIMGHTHVPDDYTYELGSRTCRYLNTGDWVSHFSYVEYDGEDFCHKNHPV